TSPRPPPTSTLFPYTTLFRSALLATIITATASLWLTPRAIRQSVAILNKLEAEQLTADIQPRVFEEQFPNTILYVGDVRPGPVRSEEHTSELQSRSDLVCRLL